MKKLIAVIIVLVMLVSVSPVLASGYDWVTYYPGDYHLAPLTDTTNISTLLLSNDLKVPIGLAPNGGDGWKVDAVTDLFWVWFFIQPVQEYEWGSLSIYVDGKLAKTVEQSPCGVLDCSSSGGIYFTNVEVLFGKHHFEIVNSGSSNLPINLLYVNFLEMPLTTKMLYLPVVSVE